SVWYRQREATQRADSRFHSRRRLAQRDREAVCLSGRNVRQGRRALHRARFCLGGQCGWESHDDGRSGAPRRGLGLQKRRQLWRRLKSTLSFRPLLGRPSRRRRSVTDWQKDFGLPRDIGKGAVLLIGVYDLKPVRRSKRSEYVRCTDEMEQALSTQRHLDRRNTRIIVSYGPLESPEFQRQSRDFVAAVKAAG